jgi:hypothetical protein
MGLSLYQTSVLNNPQRVKWSLQSIKAKTRYKCQRVSRKPLIFIFIQNYGNRFVDDNNGIGMLGGHYW